MFTLVAVCLLYSVYFSNPVADYSSVVRREMHCMFTDFLKTAGAVWAISGLYYEP